MEFLKLLAALLLLTFNTLTVSAIVPPAPLREVYDNGKIFDITHRINSDLPVFDSKDGLGNYIWLTSSIKNGSLDNVSEFKLSTHTGTHIDAPGHFFQEYYDAGYDAASFDLGTLNGPALLVDVPRDKNITADVMKSLNIPRGVRRVLFRTLNTDRKLMFQKVFDSSFVGFKADGAKWLVENTDIKLIGLDYLSVSAYVDAVPTHHTFLKNRDIVLVEGLKLDNITAGLYTVHCLPLRLVKADGCPARCILTSSFLEYFQGSMLRALPNINTDKRLMFQKEFDSSFVGFMADGAKWLVENTDIKLVGLDYLSVATYVDLAPTHLIFLKNRDIILVEGLKLDDIQAGLYTVHCLPLSLVKADGSPARCILVK